MAKTSKAPTPATGEAVDVDTANPPIKLGRSSSRSTESKSAVAVEEAPEPEDLADDEHDQNPANTRYENVKQTDDIHIAELQRMTMKELLELARQEKITEYTGLKKQDLIFRILKERTQTNGLMFGEGTLEILPDGFGFLRSPDYHYLPCPDDIYVSPSQVRRFGLRNGNTVAGQIRPPKENERYFALLRVEAINGQDPNLFTTKVPSMISHRCIPRSGCNWLMTPSNSVRESSTSWPPIGMGQRGLIVSHPVPARRSCCRQMAKACPEEHPGRLRHRAADRRAAGRSDRHGAAK